MIEIDSELKLASIDGVKIADNDTNTDLLSRIEKMELAISSLQEENQQLKENNSKITELELKISIIENKLKEIENNKFEGILPTPNYGEATRISFVNKSYTADKEGYIQIYFHYTSNKSDSIDSVSINGVEIYRFNTSSSWQNVKTPMLAVKKGDIIRYSNGAQDVQTFFYNIR